MDAASSPCDAAETEECYQIKVITHAFSVHCRKAMKPFTIRKAVQPGQSRAGNLSNADAVAADMSSSKYATGGDRL